MLKKIITTVAMVWMVSVWSMTFAVEPGQWNFGDAGSTTSVWVAWAWTDQWQGFLDVVKWFVNWILWILALIALLVLLWGWFQMVTAAWDDNKYKNGFKILKQAAIWLIMIWVAWFVVSLIFAVIWAVAWTPSTSTN